MLAGGRTVVGGLVRVMAVPGVVLRVPHIVFVLVDGDAEVYGDLLVQARGKSNVGIIAGNGGAVVRVGIIDCILHFQRGVGAGGHDHRGGVLRDIGRLLESKAGAGCAQRQFDRLVGGCGCRTRGEFDAAVVEVERAGNGLVGRYLDLRDPRTGDFALGVIRQERGVGGRVVEREMVLGNACGFGGCGYTAVAVFADVARVVRQRLRLLRLDCNLVGLRVALAGVAQGIACGGVAALKPELRLGSALHASGYGTGCEFVVDVVPGVLNQGWRGGGVVHPEAVAGRPIEVQPRAVIVGGRPALGLCIAYHEGRHALRAPFVRLRRFVARAAT